jgi:hypothetical protein
MAEPKEPKEKQPLKKAVPKEPVKEIQVVLNLYQKLHKIQGSISGLKKDETTKSQYNPNGYEYVSGEKVLKSIKPLMNQLGLLLKQEILSVENVRQDYTLGNGKNKSEILSKVMMKFTWIDVESGEKDENLFAANGQNDWEKGLGSALTYAERYFLLKYFHIATDEDDIDNPNRKPEDVEPKKQPTQTNQNKAATASENSQTSQTTNSEQKEYTGHEKAIRDCKTLSALSEAWNAIPPKEKVNFQELKDKMKTYLDEKAAKAAAASGTNTNTNQNPTS